MKSLVHRRFLLSLLASYSVLLTVLTFALPLNLRAQAPGSLDPAYPNHPATDQPVQVVIAQTDANGVTRAIIGGSFSSLLDDAGTPVPGFARFNADGSLDTGFLANVSGATLGSVTALALQPDGKILVAGLDSSSSAGSRLLLRFSADGVPDTAFHVIVDDDVESIAFQADGSILISGLFTTVNGTSGQRRLARLSPAGVLDTQFQAYTNNALTVTEVKRIAVLPGGGLLAVTHVSQGDVDYLIQLAATDGSVPDAPVFFHLANDGRIYDLNVDSTGRVIVVGNFDGIDGQPRASHIARFGAGGQLDTNFVGNPVLPSVLLLSVAVDANGQPLVGGVSFSTPALFRLTADTGALDPAFSFPLGEQTSYVQSIALQPDGPLLAAGQFSIGQNGATLVRVVTGTSGGGMGPTSGSVNVTVPGTSNIWLAGAAAGTTASMGQDTLLNATPFQASGLTITSGNSLTFSATGTVSNDPANPNTSGPDGNTAVGHILENGISDLVAPINSLLGVFLDDSTPSGTPPSGYDFSGGASPAEGVSYASLAPALRQPFFIGDGKDTNGNAQSVVIPAGATRLFLGSLDPSDQENNPGSFSVAITTGTVTPPATGPALAVNADDFSYSTKKSASTGTVVPGDTITYSLTVRNKGTAPATDVVVKASFDSNNTKLVKDGISNGGTLAGNVVTWNLPKINNGEHATLTFAVKVKAGVDTQSNLTTGAVAKSVTSDPSATVADLHAVPPLNLRIVPVFNLSASNDGATTVAGGALTYTFTVRNQGTTSVSDITVDVHLPDGYTKSNFKTATFIDDQGNPVGAAYKLGAQLDDGQFDPDAVRLSIDGLGAGQSQRFIVVVNVPFNAEPGSTINLPFIDLNGYANNGKLTYTQSNYVTTISKDPPAAPPSLVFLKLTPTAANLSTFLGAVKDPTNIFYKSAQQFFLALALYENKDPADLEALSADQLALLLNPYLSRDTDPDTGESLFDVPSPNPKQPAPYVTYFLIYANTGAGDAAGITITDSVPDKLQLVTSSITFKGTADVKSNLVGADGRSLTFTFGKVKQGTGGLIVYRANIPAPGTGPDLGDIVEPTTAVLTTDSLSGQTFYKPTENLLVTGAANAVVDSTQADPGDGTTQYTMFYQNTGGKASKDFIVVSKVPTGGIFLSADFLDIGQSVLPATVDANGTKRISVTQYIEPISAGATSGQVTFHLGKVKPRGLGLVQVKYGLTAAALAQKPAGLVHHYYVAGGTFPGATNAMRAGRPVPKWARHDEETRVARQGGDPRGVDIFGIFKQGFDAVTHAIGNFFAKPGTPQPAGVAPTLWVQRIAPMGVAENTDFNYVVTVGNSGSQPAYQVGLAVYIPTGATYVSSDGGTANSFSVTFAPIYLDPGAKKTITLTYHTTATAGSTVDSGDCVFNGFGDSAFNYQTGLLHVGPVSSLVYSAAQARNFPALQTAIASNAAKAGGIDPGALTANPLYASRAAAITPISTQTTIAHADYVTTVGGGTIVATGGGNIVASGGGNIVASGGGNLVASGGGNIVASGGGNLVASGGGNIVGYIVATGGGNITINNVPGFAGPVNVSELLSANGLKLVASGGGNLVASGGGNLVASGGGNLVASGGGNILDYRTGAPLIAISDLSFKSVAVAGIANAHSLGLLSQDGGGLLSQDGGGLLSNDGGGLLSQDGGGFKAVGGASLLSQDGGGLITRGVGGHPVSRASAVKAGTLLGSPANSISFDFNSAGGMVFGVGGSRANGQ